MPVSECFLHTVKLVLNMSAAGTNKLKYTINSLVVEPVRVGRLHNVLVFCPRTGHTKNKGRSVVC